MSGAALNGVGQLGDPSAGGSGPSGAWKIGDLQSKGASSVGLWLGDTDTDQSGNGNDLSVVGTAPTTRGQSCFGATWNYFDGNYHLDGGADASTQLLGDMTVAICLMLPREVLGGEFPNIIGRVNTLSNLAADNTCFLLWVDGTTNQFKAFHEYTAGNNTIVTFTNSRVDTLVNTPILLHLRRTISTKTYDLFYQGRKLYSNTFTNDPTNGSASTLCIGGGPAAGKDIEGCMYRSARVDNVALTDAQILTDADDVLDGRF